MITITTAAKRFETMETSALPNFFAKGFAKIAARIIPTIISIVDAD